MTDREAMKMALDAFEDLKKSVTRDGTVSENWDAYYEKEYYALEALRQALAQKQTKCPRCGEVNPAEIHTCSPQREQEPVAWVDTVWVERPDLAKEIQMNRLFSRCQLQDNQIPLYTAPPKRQWVGLTNEELVKLRETHEAHIFQLMFAIEAKLKEKNT